MTSDQPAGPSPRVRCPGLELTTGLHVATENDYWQRLRSEAENTLSDWRRATGVPDLIDVGHAPKPPLSAAHRPLTSRGDGLWTGANLPTSHRQDWVLDASDPDSWAPLDVVPDAAQLMQRVRQLQSAARASATKKSYAHWWRVFAEFCVELRWASSCETVPLPVPASLVEMWVAWLSERYAESTISISLAAISVIHSSHGIQAPTGGPRIRSLLEAVARTGKVRGVEEQVVVTPEHIKAFVKLDTAWSDGGGCWSKLRLARAKAMVCAGFMAYLRKSEVGALDRCD
eukprot:COSAG02_NODE_12087_length_1599_cov_384.894000_2_plen_286_part_01